jgi:anti-sigma factor RsiW
VIDADCDFERMQDYVVGRLSDDEQRAFEDRLVRDPALVHEFEQSLRLGEGLHQLRAQGYFDTAASRARGSRIWLPLLAAAAIAGLALFLWLQTSTGPSPVLTASLESRTAGVAPSVTAHFTFVAVRESSTPDLDLPAGGVIEFRAAPAVHMSASRYRMTLVQQDEGGGSKRVGAVAGLALSADGYVHGYADASRLGPGSYILRIEPDAETPGTPEVFPFNLRARGARPTP